MNKKAISLGAAAVIAVFGFGGYGMSTMKTRPNGPADAKQVDTSTVYTNEQVAEHKDVSSCWTTINGGVYDLTTYVVGHPGGKKAISSICGIDSSVAFNNQHGGQGRPGSALEVFKIGILAK